jgi:flagellar operon protein
MMELKKIGGLDQLIQPTSPGKIGGVGGGESFKDALNKIQNQSSLQSGMAVPNEVGPLKFSNHAVERMQTRGVKFSPEDMQRLGEAVQKARAKGSKDSLVLMNDNALIVSVKNNTVVTVVDKSSLKENVFTNIDSTIVMEEGRKGLDGFWVEGGKRKEKGPVLVEGALQKTITD